MPRPPHPSMRKTDLRSRSFNAGSSAGPLLNATSYYQASTEEDEDNSEYELVRRASSATSSSSEATDSAELSRPQRHHLLAPTSIHQQTRRHSQQAISSPRLLLSTPEFVITSASKIPETAAASRRSPPSSSSYSRGDTPDFSIYRYEPSDESDSADQVRKKTGQLEHHQPKHRLRDDNDRRWSTDSTGTGRRRTRKDIESDIYPQEIPYQDPYYPNRDLSRRRNTIVPPPATQSNPPPVSPYRRLSVGATVIHEHKQQFTPHKTLNLLSVPGYDSSSSQSVTRSRSQSTPSSPELIRQQGGHTRNQDSAPLSARSHQESPQEDMHSTYHRQRSSGQMDTRRGTIFGEEEAVREERARKYSHVEAMGGGRGQRMRSQNELRRISSSSTCVVEGMDTHRRRILPPTPDQICYERGQITPPVPPKGYQRDGHGHGAGNSLPCQQDPASFYGPHSALEGDQVAHQKNSNSRSSSSCRQIASPSQVEYQNDDQLLQNQQEAQFEETILASMRRTRRATAIGDTAMLPSSPSSSSPRTGRGRKLPETPPESDNSKPTATNKMIPFPIARQNTVGELLHQPSSPPRLFASTPRRVSEQIFPPRFSKGLLAQSPLAKSPSSENDDQHVAALTGAPSWIGSASTSAKSPDQSTPHIPPTRSNTATLKQFHQSSVSSSSSVPDLITPTNNMCASGGMGIGADGATDSGHGSGAESGVGDGATVSGSNSWPDAIGIGGLNLGSTTVIGPDCLPSSTGLGILHFTVQYFPVRKRLRVSVIKAERLAGQLRMDLELNTFVKVCLMPGKVQKQRGSRIVKRSRDATYNEEFFFDNITPEDLDTRSVLLRLCHHVGKQFQKDVVIGQLEIILKDIMPPLVAKQEVKMYQELKPKQLKKLGRLTISTCFESDDRRLTINIFKVDDLPKFGITGPPDPCVRICVDQNGKVQTKQSRTLKSTCNAVFKEAVMFLVSNKKEDLERTKIVVTVHDTARSASGDDIIGNVYLGQLACDKTELEQWRNTLTHPGREFKATHQLKKEPIAGDDEVINLHDD